MSEDNPHSSNGSSGKSWLDKLGQMFAGEPRSREELQEVFEEAAERSLIDNDTKDMIEGVLDIAEMRVRDVMIPRSHMVTIEKSQPVEEFLPIMIESAHSRFPLICEDKDHVEGILLAKDLLAYVYHNGFENFSFDELLRPAVVIPESKRLDILLKDFRKERYHMAIVVDEYGSVSGLVTIEDILELIVGEIEDEHDIQEPEDIRKVTRYVYAVNALTEIDEFNDFFKTQWQAEDVDTIGGLVIQAFGHLPTKGESVEVNGFNFKVVSCDGRRINQLQMTIPRDSEETKEVTV
ncbi:magnesium and cobalt efflux protein CorC [Catenovulum agarivorans DS-2]|uniref:Magnesium and cobalt efflux protein CorC n=1 Tax=Catenovulum agarivorans DS-2 TaxID=1328313 RepID=W7QJ77_9ALTE|nr:CNNM family magnesium/cobalt transport protein CorC [Catenovulum agarivorans]EWH08188.1 magnesium and cobalt efflux protein CorC [Catenovulum agarivorans DS-2]